MKIKYYLRGLGTGILFATIILTISFAVRNSDKETSETEGTTSESRVQVETESESESETETAETTTESTTGLNDDKVVISIKPGMSSEDVAQLLSEKGVFENATEFDTYLKNNGYSKTIVVGDYNIEPGLTFKEIAEIITNTN